MFDDSFWQNKEPNIANDSSKIQDQEQVRSYKDNVKSINMIVSKEIEDKANQMLHSIVEDSETPKCSIQHNSDIEQHQVQNDISSLELSQFQSQVFSRDQVKEGVEENNKAHDEVNEFEDSQIHNQNPKEEDKHVSMSIDINSDASYAQMWKKRC